MSKTRSIIYYSHVTEYDTSGIVYASNPKAVIERFEFKAREF